MPTGHILCPVPGVLLPSALDTFAAHGCVAFGSAAFDVLNKFETGGGGFVWIAATSTDATGPIPQVTFGKVCFKDDCIFDKPSNDRGFT